MWALIVEWKRMTMGKKSPWWKSGGWKGLEMRLFSFEGMVFKDVLLDPVSHSHSQS